MTTTYLTGTRYPGKALKAFLPDYLDLLAQRGNTVLTTNKPGVDRLVLQHCDTHRLPLQVIEFACDSGDRNRRVKAKSGTVQIHKVVSPSWQRFQHVIDKADKVMFFHAAKTHGRCDGLSTIQAFDKACERRGIAGEQLIIQSQHATWVSETELRNSPTIGSAHIYVYSRFAPGLDEERHSIGFALSSRIPRPNWMSGSRGFMGGCMFKPLSSPLYLPCWIGWRAILRARP